MPRSPLGYVGRALIIAGAVLIPVALFLTFFHFQQFHLSGWKAYASTDVVLTVIAMVSVVLVILSFFVAPRTLVLVAAPLSAVLLGAFIPEKGQWHFYGAGYWLGFAGALIAFVGAGLTMFAELAEPRGATRA